MISTLNFFHLPADPSPVTADINCDGSVTLTDFVALIDCLAGPNLTPTPTLPVTGSDCLMLFDANHDGDVDLEDAATIATWLNP